MLKIIGPSVAASSANAASFTTSTHVAVSSAGRIAPRHSLPEALRHLQNVDVNQPPIFDDRRPGIFISSPLENAARGRARRKRGSKGIRRMRCVLDKQGRHDGPPVRRFPRHLPERALAGSPAVALQQHDDVAAVPLPTFSVTASLSLKSLEDSLSRCANPVTGLLRDVRMFYAMATDRTLPDDARQYLEGVGQFVDFVGGFHPTLGMVQGVCSVGARSLAILRGSPVTDDDLTNVTAMMKSAARHRQAGRWPGDDAALGGTKDRAMGRTLAQDEPPSHADVEVEEHEMPGPAGVFELHYAEVADREVGADRDAALADDAAGEDDSVTVNEGHGRSGGENRHADGERIAPHDGQAATASGGLGIDRAITLPGATSGQWQPNPYAMIDAVPIVYVPAEGDLPARWRRMPLSHYAEKVSIPRGVKDGDPFRVFGVDFVLFEGLAYPLYVAPRGNEFIYSVSHARLPPLPLVRSGARRMLKAPTLHPVKHIGVFPGTDGFIRSNNKRYVIYGKVVLETDRPRLIGEVQIAHHAMVIDATLPAPNLDGLIQTPSGMTVIEGSNGYYRARKSAVTGDVEVLDAEGRTIGVRLKYDNALRRWSISSDWRDAPLIREGSRDSLDVYQTKVEWSTFLRQRPELQKAVRQMLAQLNEHNLYRPNRLSPHGAGPKWITDIYTVRQAISKYLRTKGGWETLSVKEKQRAASAATWGFFSDNKEWAWAPGSQAFCSEMLDMAFRELSFAGIDDRHLLQVVFEESPGSGRSHVAMLYADDPDVFGKFGEIDKRAVDVTLRGLDHHAFADWLLQHRETVAIIDPWGPEKVNDFIEVADRSEVQMMINVNLREAKFNMDDPVRYRVGALVPSRDVKANQRIALVASKDVTGDQKAPCSLLSLCKS